MRRGMNRHGRNVRGGARGILSTAPALRLRGDGYSASGTATWTDEISGLLFQQATAANKPTASASDAAFNSKPIVSFDGGDRLVSTAAATLWKPFHAAPFTAAICFLQNTINSGIHTILSTIATQGGTTAGVGIQGSAFCMGSGAASNYNGAYGGTAAGYVASVAVWLILRWDGTTGSAKMQNWKSSQTTWSNMNLASAIGTGDPNNTLWIGDYSGAARGLNGKIAEILCWDRRITDDEGTLVKNWFVSEYAAVS